MVAGGAGADSDEISGPNIFMANARIDEFGGNTSFVKEINKDKGTSGKSRWIVGFSAGAGFYSSPPLKELSKDYVKSLPKVVFLFKGCIYFHMDYGKTLRRRH